MTAVDDIAQQAPTRRADDQTGRAVVALTIIAAIGTPIDTVVGPQHALTIGWIVAIIARGIIAALIAVVGITARQRRGRRPARGIANGVVAIPFGLIARGFLVIAPLRIGPVTLPTADNPNRIAKLNFLMRYSPKSMRPCAPLRGPALNPP
jgi:hypothetical protein